MDSPVVLCPVPMVGTEDVARGQSGTGHGTLERATFFSRIFKVAN